MKIVIVTGEFPPLLGGAGVFAYGYAQAFASLGHKVTVVTSTSNSNVSQENDFDVIRLSRAGIFWPVNFYSVVSKLDYDLVILNDPPAIYMAGLLFSKKQFEKAFCFLHGSEASTVYLNSTLKRKIIGFRFFYNKAHELCKTVCFPSSFMRSNFFRQVHGLTYENKSIVSYGGVDTNSFDVGHDEVSDGAKINILTAARVKREKGYLTKLDLITKLIINYNVDIHWHIAGDGDYLNELKEQVAIRNISENVTFHGKLDRARLAKLFKIADIFLLLSEYTESFGLVYLEAAASGCVSIGYNRDGVREAIKLECSGFLINNSEEFLDIVLSGRWRLISKEECRKFALDNNVIIHAKKLLSYASK